MSHILGALDIIFGGIFLSILYDLLAKHRRGPLPAGPRGWPLIGSVLEWPQSHEWLTFAKWGEKWGDIMSATLLGQTIVILNSAAIAEELLDKRSSLYSDRPTLMMAGELVGWSNSLALSRYGNRFREYRRFIFRVLGTRAQVQQYHALSVEENQRFLHRLLHDPDNVAAHIRKTAGAIILKISHGYIVKEGQDQLVDLVDLATEQFSELTRPGAFLVDVLPFLRHVPSWFPGGGYKNELKAWTMTVEEMADMPHEFVKQQMKVGAHIPNFTSHLLETEKLTPEKEFNIKWSAASLYAGGADTTVAAIYSFFLVMSLYPDVQKKAQDEIDSVIGNDRLPRFEDRDNLPYVDALVKEVFRFHPVAPLGIPHRLIQDDHYNGYCIPKDTLVVANIWKFLNDPDVYFQPSVFNPSRFLSGDGHVPEKDPRGLVFGFGRRICPGMHLADASVFVSCAMTLSVFDISKYVQDGQVVEPVYEAITGTISHPKPFKCSIKPRSAKAKALILGDISEST